MDENPSSSRSIIDWHTHMWLPEHLGDEWGPELDSKSRSRLPPSTLGRFEQHREAMAKANVVAAVVVGLTSRYLGMDIPNDFIAECVARDPAHLIGLASVDPNDPGAVKELLRAPGLGLRGLKLSPPYQNFHPHGKEAWSIYECADELNLFVMFHQGAVFSRRGVMEFAYPMLLDKVAREFPGLRIVIAHAGQPWTFETVSLMYKHPNVYMDISARFSRPGQLYGILSQAVDYGVQDKVLWGSDFPAYQPDDCVDQFLRINERAGVTTKPIPETVIREILYNRPLSILELG
jgi:predicted TIM-barrel fold metal-dependent hydrolase